MKRVSLRDTFRKAKRVSHCKTSHIARNDLPQFKMLIILITESTRFVLCVNLMLQSDFSGNVKCQTERGREMIKRTGTNKGTHNTSRDLEGLRKWHTNRITEAEETITYYGLLQMYN